MIDYPYTYILGTEICYWRICDISNEISIFLKKMDLIETVYSQTTKNIVKLKQIYMKENYKVFSPCTDLSQVWSMS